MFMVKIPSMVWISAIYLLAALLIQMLFFKKEQSKFFLQRDSIFKVIRKPLVFSLWTLAISYAFGELLHAVNIRELDHTIDQFRSCFLIGAVALAVHSYKNHFIKVVLKQHPLHQDTDILNGINKLLSGAIWVIAGLLILDALGFKSGPLIAFGGVGAAALGFAAKDVISNFFGGFMLVITRPFNHGDCILVPERKIEAYVVHMGWYMTTLKDKAKRFVYVPNSAFVHAYIVNESRRTHRKIKSFIKIKPTGKAGALEALDKIRRILDEYPGIDHSLNPYASLEACDGGLFDIKISAYAEIRDEREFSEFQEKLLLSLHDTLVACGMKDVEVPLLMPFSPH